MTICVPILTWPGGDRNATRGIAAAVQKDAMAIDAWDAGLKTLLPLTDIQTQVDAVLAHHPEAVFFYTGAVMIGHLRELKARKAATTHIHPSHLLQRLGMRSFTSLQDDFGLQFLSCPIYAGDTNVDRNFEYHPDILWTETVPAFIPPPEDARAVMPEADTKNYFVVPLPGVMADKIAEAEAQSRLAQIIHDAEDRGEEVLILVSPRTGDYLQGLQTCLRHPHYRILHKMDSLTAQIMPAIRKNPQSRLFLSQDSGSMLAEAVSILPPSQILCAALGPADQSEDEMLDYFFHTLHAVTMLAAGKLMPPSANPLSFVPAAQQVAAALQHRFC